MAGNDHLRGDAVVLNQAGEPVYEFGASTSCALGGRGRAGLFAYELVVGGVLRDGCQRTSPEA